MVMSIVSPNGGPTDNPANAGTGTGTHTGTTVPLIPLNPGTPGNPTTPPGTSSVNPVSTPPTTTTTTITTSGSTTTTTTTTPTSSSVPSSPTPITFTWKEERFHGAPDSTNINFLSQTETIFAQIPYQIQTVDAIDYTNIPSPVSVRWTTTLNFTPGDYTFNLLADDGMRVILDGQIVLDGWKNQSGVSYTGTTHITAGVHTLIVEYYNLTRFSVAKFNAAYVPTGPAAPQPFVIFSEYVVSYDYTLGTLKPLPQKTISLSNPSDFNIIDVSVATLPGFVFTPAVFTLTPHTFQNVVVSVDPTAVDKLPAGLNEMSAVFSLNIDSPAPIPPVIPPVPPPPVLTWTEERWSGFLFASTIFNQSPIPKPTSTTTVGSINHPPGTSIPPNTAIRWTSTFAFTAGTYTFTMTTDDGMRVKLDNALILNSWKTQEASVYQTTIPVSAGTHTIVVEYFNAGGNSAALFSFASTQTPTPTTPTGGPTMPNTPNPTPTNPTPITPPTVPTTPVPPTPTTPTSQPPTTKNPTTPTPPPPPATTAPPVTKTGGGGSAV